MSKRGRPLQPGEKLSEVWVPRFDKEGKITGDGVDVWMVISDPSKSNYFVFWFDRKEGETLAQVALF